MPTLHVKASWDDEARVWVATSQDLPGLITEADTVEELSKKLPNLILDLLEENGELNNGPKEIPFSLMAETLATIKVNKAAR